MKRKRVSGCGLAQNFHGDNLAAFPVVRFVHGSESASSQTAADVEAFWKADIGPYGQGGDGVRSGAGTTDLQSDVSGEFRIAGGHLFEESRTVHRAQERYRVEQRLNLALSLGIQEWTSGAATAHHTTRKSGGRLALPPW